MASRRALLSLAVPLRASASSLLRPQFVKQSVQAVAPISARINGLKASGPVEVQRRGHAGFPSEKKSKVWEYDDVARLVINPTTDIMLIDVREPAEVAAGAIPTAYNIPISSHPDALLLPPDEFESQFGFAKPPPSKELVFYCKAGVRSAAAAQLAKQGGYEKVGEYRGSWLDWERHRGVGSAGKSSPGVEGKKLGEGWERKWDGGGG